jgi:hypothetical protein
MNHIPFDHLPRVIFELQEKVDRQTQLLEQLFENNLPDKDIWMNIDQLSKYLPDHPAKKTVYKKVEQRIIPFHRRDDGKTLYFLKSEIDLYLKEGRQKTSKEISVEVDDLLSTGGRQKRK